MTRIIYYYLLLFRLSKMENKILKSFEQDGYKITGLTRYWIDKTLSRIFLTKDNISFEYDVDSSTLKTV